MTENIFLNMSFKIFFKSMQDEGYNESLFLLLSQVVIEYGFEQVTLSILKSHLCSFNKTINDHVFSTIPNSVTNHDIVHTEEISDHDTPYVIFNIKKEKYQPRYKFIRNEKNLDMNSYTSDFQQLRLNLVCSFDDPGGHVSIFNKLVVDCINTHAPLRKVKLTRPVGPWMYDPKIANLQKDLDTQLTNYRNHKSSSNHTNYQNTRNKL